MARLIATLTLVAACVSRPAPSPPDPPDASDAATAAAITLERTACFGECPVYRIAVSPAGRVTYEGSANVRRIGTANAQIAADSVNALLVELERAGYFTFKGRTKRIEHDYGCAGVPGALTVLEKRIDEVLGSEQWTGR
jgi:hypothetical protein